MSPNVMNAENMYSSLHRTSLAKIEVGAPIDLEMFLVRPIEERISGMSSSGSPVDWVEQKTHTVF
jgi:hypothetical protein